MLAREAKESSVLQSRAASLDVYRITYRGLLDQRHVRLLGRSIDVNRLIAQVQLCVRVCVCVPVSVCCVLCCVLLSMSARVRARVHVESAPTFLTSLM